MDTKELLDRLEGVQTIDSIMASLDVSRNRAVYLAHKLREEGLLKAKMGPGRKRVYSISFSNKLGGESYYDIINSRSPVKVAEIEVRRVYGRNPSLEEALVFAIMEDKLRLVLASLALFKSICNWPLLYKLAAAENAERKVGALYELSRTVMKTRRMDGRTMRRMLPVKGDGFQYIIEGFRSDDFREIENKWKVYLPFNRADLEDYARGRAARKASE